MDLVGATDAGEQGRSEETPVAAEGAPPAAEERPGLARIAWRLGLVLGLVVLDLWSKAAVFAWLDPATGTAEMVSNCCGSGHQRHMVLGEGVTWFAFMLSENKGAAFGSFAQWPYLLVGGRVVAALFLLWLILRTPARRRWFALALMLVLAGALGNLYDNLFRTPPEGHPWGSVRDFIDVYLPFADWGWFSLPNWHFPTFNVADSCITVGAVLLLLTGLGPSEPREASGAEAEPPSTSE